MFKEAAEDKEERFRRLDLIIEFDLFDENLCWPNESQEPGRPAGGLLPEKDRPWSKARAELVWRESRQIAQGVDAPFVQDRDNVGELFGAGDGAQRRLFGGLIARHERKLGPERNMFNRTYFMDSGWWAETLSRWGMMLVFEAARSLRLDRVSPYQPRGLSSS